MQTGWLENDHYEYKLTAEQRKTNGFMELPTAQVNR